jgi:uncharacterized glyoxalase superfamily protein PhnB
MDKMPTLIPYLTVKSTKDSIQFYQNAFDFKWINQHDGEDCPHGEMQYKDVIIMFSSEGAYNGTTKTPNSLGVECSMNLYLYCDDVDALYANALNHGAISCMEPHDAFWGDRTCQVKDLDGFMWMFATRQQDKSL